MASEITGSNPNNSNNRARGIESSKGGDYKKLQKANTDNAVAGAASLPEEKANLSNEQTKIELSDTGKLMQKVEEKIGQQPIKDEGRIEYFKELINNSKYFIDFPQLSENIVKSDNQS